MDYLAIHFPDQHRFEIVVDGKIAYLEYETKKQEMDIVHTVVPRSLEGRGIGSALMKEALRYAEEKQLNVIPTCSFAQTYMMRHK